MLVTDYQNNLITYVSDILQDVNLPTILHITDGMVSTVLLGGNNTKHELEVTLIPFFTIAQSKLSCGIEVESLCHCEFLGHSEQTIKRFTNEERKVPFEPYMFNKLLHISKIMNLVSRRSGPNIVEFVWIIPNLEVPV
jgi:hypothetical protein